MKTYKHLFEKMLEPENMKRCLTEASKGKTRGEVKRVTENADEYLARLRELLQTGTYCFSRGSQTLVSTPDKKERLITKPKFIYDQIVHHLIVSQLKPIVMKSLYEFACGSIPDRGPHFGKKHLRKWIDSYGEQPFYVLKADIHHFYDSVDHTILKRKLHSKIKDDAFLSLVFDLIDTGGPGIPQGYSTSPWLANFLLTDLDHYIKENLKAPYYMRYLDDIVILSPDKEKLHEIKDSIETYLRTHLNLQLKENWQVYRFVDTEDKNGRDIDFMGFRFFRNKTTLRKSNLKKIRRKANKLEKKRERAKRDLGPGVNAYDARSMLSYLGWTEHADVYGYYQREIKPKIDKRQLRRKVSAQDREKIILNAEDESES